jgi:hypothetical protein
MKADAAFDPENVNDIKEATRRVVLCLQECPPITKTTTEAEWMRDAMDRGHSLQSVVRHLGKAFSHCLWRDWLASGKLDGKQALRAWLMATWNLYFDVSGRYVAGEKPQLSVEDRRVLQACAEFWTGVGPCYMTDIGASPIYTLMLLADSDAELNGIKTQCEQVLGRDAAARAKKELHSLRRSRGENNEDDSSPFIRPSSGPSGVGKGS